MYDIRILDVVSGQGQTVRTTEDRGPSNYMDEETKVTARQISGSSVAPKQERCDGEGSKDQVHQSSCCLPWLFEEEQAESRVLFDGTNGISRARLP